MTKILKNMLKSELRQINCDKLYGFYILKVNKSTLVLLENYINIVDYQLINNKNTTLIKCNVIVICF